MAQSLSSLVSTSTIVEMQTQKQRPIWIWGIVVGLLLIGISMQSRSWHDETALRRHFATGASVTGNPDAPPMPQLDMTSLPTGIQQTVRDLQQQLHMGQSIPALTPVAQSVRLRVEVQQVQRRGDDAVQIQGQVTNISNTELVVPISAFALRDNMGMSYAPGGDASVTLLPGDSTPLDLTVPIPTGRGLLLAVSLPPDPPVEQVLLVSE